MADFDDVLTALATLIDSVVYPNGDAQPSAIVVNASPVPTRIYPGWPVSSKLDADLLAGILNISVFAPPGTEQNTTRFPMDEVVVTNPVHTVTAAIDTTGTRITIGGTISTPQNVAAIVNGLPFVYGVQANDTPSTIAAALAALINASTPASANGPVISIPAAKQLVARIGGAGTVAKPVGTQRRQFQITIWAPTPAARTAAAKLIDPALRAASRLSFPDGTKGTLVYAHTFTDDVVQKANLWRRDLFYVAEYTAVQESTAYEIVVEKTVVTGGVDPTNPPIATFYD